MYILVGDVGPPTPIPTFELDVDMVDTVQDDDDDDRET